MPRGHLGFLKGHGGFLRGHWGTSSIFPHILHMLQRGCQSSSKGPRVKTLLLRLTLVGGVVGIQELRWVGRSSHHWGKSEFKIDTGPLVLSQPWGKESSLSTCCVLHFIGSKAVGPATDSMKTPKMWVKGRPFLYISWLFQVLVTVAEAY